MTVNDSFYTMLSRIEFVLGPEAIDTEVYAKMVLKAVVEDDFKIEDVAGLLAPINCKFQRYTSKA